MKEKFVFDLIPSLIFILDKNKNVIEVNERIKDLGYEVEELKGKNISQLPIINEKIIENLFEKKEYVFKIDILTKEGRKRVGIAELREIEGEKEQYILIIHDITKEEFLRMKLEEKEEMLKYWYNFAENSVSGVYIIDEDLNFLYVNSAFCEILNMDKEEIMKKKVYDVIYFEDVPFIIEEIKKEFLGEGRPESLIVRGISKNGRIKYGKLSGKLAKLNGKKVIMGTVIDITEMKEYEERLKEEHQLLEKTLEGTIYAITKIVETRDPYTAGHQLRVTKLCETIGKELGVKSMEMSWASLLHDVGKISVPSEILVMPRKLNSIEFAIIKTHPITGYNIVKVIPNFEKVAEIILQHHERLDGSGYPKGIKGKEIMKEARILGVSDVVEAMISYRPYRPALSLDDAIEEIYKNRGVKYDKEVVEVCINLFKSKRFCF